jgi:septum formation protein
MLENLKKYNVILASNSPRRKELLSGLGIDYSIKVLSGIEEVYPDSLKKEDIPIYISREKAEAYLSSMSENDLIITADTIVLVNGNVLGKPENEDKARCMLHQLSGKTHEVITGVSLTTKSFQHSFSSVSKVKFAKLTNEEIDYYIVNYHPMDKAGAYGIQEWIGFVGVENIKGSFYNIMGLPIQKLYNELKKI